MRTIRLTSEEHERLVKLYREARTTPVLVIGPGPDTATLAWDRVRQFMDELGRKYGYNPATARITFSSPEFEVE